MEVRWAARAAPAALPFILVGVRQAIGQSLVVAVVVGIITGNEGIGYYILFHQQAFNIPGLLAGVVAIAAVGYGLKIGWAFAWRTLIAAELVFGVTSSAGGLGWFIFRNRNELYTDKVFAGLAMVIIIGILVEGVVFRFLEKITVRRWGMQR